MCDGDGSVTWDLDLTAIYLQCRISREWIFSEPFKDIFIKHCFTVCHGRTNSLWKIPLVSKKPISIDLIFDLLIRAFLGRGYIAVCHASFCLLVSEVISQIHDLSPVITLLNKSWSLTRRSGHLILSNILLLNCYDYGHHFTQNLMNGNFINI